MELEHNPSGGVSLEEDLSGATIVLTRQRGGDYLTTGLGVSVLLLLAFFSGSEIWVYFGGMMGSFGFLLNVLKTEVSLGARSLTIERRTLGMRQTRTTIVYEAITSIELEPGTLGRHTMTIHRVGGEPVVIHHGTDEDHQALQLRIDARRPIQELPAAEDLEAPPELRALRQHS